MPTRKLQTVLILAACALLTSCATKTPPSFLQNASAGMWGGMMSTPDGRMMMSTPQPRRNGFETFFGGQD